ncbi:hypothetical protein SORBI_3009G096850 [Sorghum bicolor]|uniref:Secreted protein n=1 Tax=Sorghum bicolor TaxID=4558 RepID=A0A1Z5R1Y3_SORBI|nr:hypothetical protein SORBI_3009G096850 [Sorghum bicolor]
MALAMPHCVTPVVVLASALSLSPDVATGVGAPSVHLDLKRWRTSTDTRFLRAGKLICAKCRFRLQRYSPL